MSPFVRSKIAEHKGEGSQEMKVTTPGKIVPYKCCIPSSNNSLKDFGKDVFFNYVVTHFQELSVTLLWKKCKQTYLIDKAVLGNMHGVLCNLCPMLTKDNDM